MDNTESTLELLQGWYRKFAEYTIADRGIPYSRDGAIPVQTKIIWTTLNPDMPFQFNIKTKLVGSPSLVGAVMGHYHPVGDATIYGTLVDMAQRYASHRPVITPQGGFGAPDAPQAVAAARYTAVGGSPLYGVMFKAPSEDSPGAWTRNYNDTDDEPTYIDVALPLCLVKGTEGIAVSISTKIPMFNPGELIDAILDHLEKDVSLEEAVRTHVKGPDYPLGGEVAFSGDILTSGNGRLHVYPIIEVADNRIRAHHFSPQLLSDSLEGIRNDCGKRGCGVVVDEYDNVVWVTVKDPRQVSMVEGVVRANLSYTRGYDFTVIHHDVPYRASGLVDMLSLFLTQKTDEELEGLPDRLRILRKHCRPRTTEIVGFKQLLSALSVHEVVTEHTLHISALGKIKVTPVGVAWKHSANGMDYTTYSQPVTSATPLLFMRKGKAARKSVKELYADLSSATGVTLPYSKGGVELDSFVHPCIAVHTTSGVFKGKPPTGEAIRTYVVAPGQYLLIMWENQGVSYLLTDKKLVDITPPGAIKYIGVVTLVGLVTLTERTTHRERYINIRNLRVNVPCSIPGTERVAFSSIKADGLNG